MTEINAGSRGLFIVGGLVKSRLDGGSRQVVEDHLATLLQVHNLVVVIGSGASFHLGSPQTRNLKNAAVEKLILNSGANVESSESKLLESLNPANNGDLEKLLNGLQLAAALADQTGRDRIVLGEESSTSSFTLDDIEALRKKIAAALAHGCSLPGDYSNVDVEHLDDPMCAHRTFISRIVRGRRANLPRPRLFTTNYDLVIEHALDELGYPYIDGFSGTVDRRLNLAYYGLDFHRVDTTSQQVLARADSALYLYKVHGSLNWRAVSVREASTGMQLPEIRQVSQDEAGTTDRVLIYPTTAKEGDTLAYPYSDLMRLLGDAVQQDDTAVVSVGYGFADPHINRILLRSLAMNPALHVLVVDPFAVLEQIDLERLVEDDRVVGRRLTETGVTPKSTAIAALAQGTDSRIAVLTGDAGKFTNFAELIPDPSIDSGMAPPSTIVGLIESLQAAMTRGADRPARVDGDADV